MSLILSILIFPDHLKNSTSIIVHHDGKTNPKSVRVDDSIKYLSLRVELKIDVL